MSIAGWITMLSAIGGATVLFGWCLWRVLRAPDTIEHLHSPADIEPPDQRTP